MVAALLEHLHRIGHIQDYFNYGEGCQDCGLKSSCSIENNRTIRLWQGSQESANKIGPDGNLLA